MKAKIKKLYRIILLIALTPNIPIVAEEPETYTLPDIHVIAQRDHLSKLPERDLVERPFTESPGLETAITIIGRPEIEEMHPYSLVDAMVYVPGSWIETRGRKTKQFFSVRGQRYPYPGYLIDGAWFREFDEINYFLSAATFDRIEVLRSSSALLLGPGGLTGMINLMPRDYDFRETGVEGIYGTHEMYRANISHGSKGDGYNYALSVGQYHTDGPSGRNAEENMTNLYGRIKWDLNSKLTLSWTNFYLDGDREMETALPPATRALQTRRESFDPMKAYLSVAKLRHQQEDTQTTEFIINYGSKRFLGHRDANPDARENEYEYGASIIFSRELNSINILRVSVIYNRWQTPTGKRFYVGNPGDISTYSAAVVDDIDFGNLDLSLGYRFTREYVKEFGGFNIEGTAGNLFAVKVHDEWSDPLHTLNFGLSYAINDFSRLFGNISWGQLASEPGMLTADYKRPGSEDRIKIDLGFRQNIESFGDISLAGFYVHRYDAPLASDTTVSLDDIDYALYSSEDQKNYGIELEVRSKRFKNGLQIFINSTLMETERTQDGSWKEDKEIPEFILNGGITYIYKKLELAFYAKHVSEYENNRFLPNGSDPIDLGDYNDYTGQITYYHNIDTRIFMKMENMASTAYSTVAGYPHEGALFSMGFTKSFK